MSDSGVPSGKPRRCEVEVALSFEAELDVACAAAREAGSILLSYFATDRVRVRAKGARDVVTAADLASEHHVTGKLKDAFPGDGIVGEEGSNVESSAARRWFVDPLDGTLNYSHAIPIWCVSLALFEGDQPVVGVIHDPLRGETFRAIVGGGAWCNSTRIQTTGETSPRQAVVHLTVDFNDASMLQGLEDIQLLAPQVLRTRNIGSAALALAYVAAGRFDAMLHRFAHTWDYGAGVLLVREAGGRVSDMDGREYTDQTASVLAAGTVGLHAGLLDLL